ncbi:MAG: PHB depolymerase family esterase [Gemmataceae bacterium]
MSLPAGTQPFELRHGGRTRGYLLHVPPSHQNSPSPLVLALHGATSNARLMEKFCGLSAKADAAGFLVAYPSGTGALPNVLTWNAGACCGYAAQHQVDDVGFIAALLDDVAGRVAIDPRRIYATGMSNGAQMVFRLAGEMAERFAAVATVAGALGLPRVAPTRPISLMHFHGTEDEFTPFAGGRGARSVYGADFLSVDATIGAWVEANGCPPEPRVELFPDRVGDGTAIVRKVYGPGRGGVEVRLVVIEGGGHTWPGRPPLPLALGKSTGNVQANDWIWEFFEKRSL